MPATTMPTPAATPSATTDPLAGFEVYRSGPHFTLRCKGCGRTWPFVKTDLPVLVNTANEHSNG